MSKVGQQMIEAMTEAVAASTVQRVILHSAIEPAFDLLAACGIRSNDAARQMVLTIAGQEGGWTHRRQMGNGPARGLWQFERGGGVKGVLEHPASRQAAAKLCGMRGVYPSADKVWAALEFDDVLAAGFARLLLWTDPKALPAYMDDGWDLYLRTWRPGKPHIERWAGNWNLAAEALR